MVTRLPLIQFQPNITGVLIALCLLLANINQHSRVLAQVAGQQSQRTPLALTAERKRLDQTVWAKEVEAQRVEQRIVRLWDELRRSANQLQTLAQFPLNSIQIGAAAAPESLELGIRRIRFAPTGRTQAYDAAQWKRLLGAFAGDGIELVESEWHHSAFDSGKQLSTVDFVLHLIKKTKAKVVEPRYVIRGQLKIRWASNSSSSAVDADSIVVNQLEILARDAGPGFRSAFTARRRPQDVASAHPIIVHDLDRNGLPEIVISRWNRVYWNEGKGRFTEKPLLKKPIRLAEIGLMADFNRDGNSDFLSANKLGELVLFTGAQNADKPREFFAGAAQVVSAVRVPAASVLTSGDVDGDGDVDVFVAQYRPAYQQGQMPTPYYDANDGEPAYLLLNDGTGQLTDVTQSAGLTAYRNRRTYSASLVDLDSDQDLDLIRVSDYAGVDVFTNDGSGQFTETTKRLGTKRHLFGMAHAFGDYNLDGLQDIYAIGMSSTTARRLDAMKLGRDDRPDIHQMRAAMGFGNRMYLADGKGNFKTPTFANQVARTGWSWGTTAFDYDLDGDEDVYVANGFRSGDSCEDYCSTFWRHDIYAGDSKANPTMAGLFAKSMLRLNQRSISWNGYEHNALLQNIGGQQFANVAFLMGVGCEFDSRSVIGTDLDGDGRQDLIVSDYEFVGRGFISSFHVFRNTLRTKNNWIGFRVYDDGIAGGLSGATAQLESNGRSQVRQLINGDSFASQHDNVFHFGLGKTSEVDQVTIRLPNGETSTIKNPQLNRYHGVSAK